jgi:dephospho-CoA kinase
VPAARQTAPRIPFVGLTGPIAAGKSEALAALDRLGAATLSADAVVHDLLADQRVRELLVARWGDDVAPRGTVDRDRVGAIVFESPDELAWLERTLHPLVGEKILAWRDALETTAPVAVVEVPLLFESGMDAVFDATISIAAADETRVRRAGARGTADLEARAGRQLPADEKAARATHVIDNEGSVEDLEAALRELMPRLSRGADGGV